MLCQHVCILVGFGQTVESLNFVEMSACSSGVAEPITVTDNNDGTHTANYSPANDGPYTVYVKYADQEVPCRSVSQELTVYLLM